MIRRKRNIAGYIDEQGRFRPIRSPKYVGTSRRPAKAKDRKKYSRAKAGDLGKRRQMLAREDVFDRSIRKQKEEDARWEREKARITREIEADVYGEDFDKRNKGKGRTLLQFVRDNGGIRRHARFGGSKYRGKRSYWDAGEINRLSYKETGVRGLTTDDAKGKYLDGMFQAAREAGYNVESMDDLISRVEDEAAGGKPTYKTHGYLDYRDNPAKARSHIVSAAEFKRLQAVTRRLSSRIKNALVKRNPVGWFREVSPVTAEAIKKLYKKLATKYHPDKPGGDLRTMQEINADYDKAMKIAASNEGNEKRAEAERNAAKPLREAIEFAVTLPDDVEVVIRGLWLWLQGNTYASRERIKSFVASDGKRFKWASQKKAWFFAAVPSSNRRGEMSFEDIDALHGRELVSERRRRLSLNPRSKKNPIRVKLHKFYAGQKLSTRSIGDYDTIYRATVISRTPKMITFDAGDGVKRAKIHRYGDTETFYPFGQYSMAASFHAKEGDRWPAKKNPVPTMHPIAAAAAGLSAVSTALHIHEQIGKDRMKKAKRRTASRSRKTNGTTLAKRRNPTSRNPTSFENIFEVPVKIEGIAFPETRVVFAKTSTGAKRAAIASTRKWHRGKKITAGKPVKKNPTVATLARCRKLLAADRRSTKEQIAKIPISHYRNVANPKGNPERCLRCRKMTPEGVYDLNGGYCEKCDKNRARRSSKRKTNPRRLRKVSGMAGRSRRVLPRISRRKVKRNTATIPTRRTFEMFQGRPATTAKPMSVSHFYAGKNLDTLGDLIELKLHSGRLLKFNPARTKLCAAGGKLIIAGDGARIAKPNPSGLSNGIDAIDSIDHVVYRTYKPHHGDAPNQQYIHKLGEETGHMPLLCADKKGFAVIRGGRYKIEARGIVN